jgi:chromosome segregation ATPase
MAKTEKITVVCNECGKKRKVAANTKVETPRATQDVENERTVRSLAAMLGWENTPPRETLERSLSALRSRWQEAEAARQGAQADLENALARERKLQAELSSLRSQVETVREEILMLAIVAGQASIEGPRHDEASRQAIVAERCSRWADLLSAGNRERRQP